MTQLLNQHRKYFEDLFDKNRAISSGFVRPDQVNKISDDPKKAMKRIVPFDIDPVVRYADMSGHVNDLPSVALPWPHVFIEYDVPEDWGDSGHMHHWRAGIMAHAIELNPPLLLSELLNEGDPAMQLVHFMTKKGIPLSEQRKRNENLKPFHDLSIRWIHVYQAFMATKRHVQDLFTTTEYIQADGKIIGGLDTMIGAFFHDMGKDVANGSLYLLKPMYFALALAHCKNVRLKSVPGEKRGSKKRRRKEPDPIMYKRLDIFPIGREWDDDEHEDTDEKMRRHLCRGHFKDYRQGGGLFGRYRDIFWFSPHMRGDESIGKVEKEYRAVPEEVIQQTRNLYTPQ